MKKLYSIKGKEEVCYPIEYLQTLLDVGFWNEEVKQLKLEVWALKKGVEDFWCTKFNEGYESTKDVCGRFCDSYAPRNGKSGRCRWHSSPYRPTGETLVIRRKGRGDE